MGARRAASPPARLWAQGGGGFGRGAARFGRRVARSAPAVRTGSPAARAARRAMSARALRRSHASTSGACPAAPGGVTRAARAAAPRAPTLCAPVKRSETLVKRVGPVGGPGGEGRAEAQAFQSASERSTNTLTRCSCARTRRYAPEPPRDPQGRGVAAVREWLQAQRDSGSEARPGGHLGRRPKRRAGRRGPRPTPPTRARCTCAQSARWRR